MDAQKIGYRIIYFYPWPLAKIPERIKEREPLIKKIKPVSAYSRIRRVGDENKGEIIDLTA